MNHPNVQDQNAKVRFDFVKAVKSQKNHHLKFSYHVLMPLMSVIHLKVLKKHPKSDVTIFKHWILLGSTHHC